jgi:hypothetical protein
MYAQIEKPKENKSRAVANGSAQKKSGVKQGFGFVDNRNKNYENDDRSNVCVVQRVKGKEEHKDNTESMDSDYSISNGLTDLSDQSRDETDRGTLDLEDGLVFSETEESEEFGGLQDMRGSNRKDKVRSKSSGKEQLNTRNTRIKVSNGFIQDLKTIEKLIDSYVKTSQRGEKAKEYMKIGADGMMHVVGKKIPGSGTMMKLVKAGATWGGKKIGAKAGDKLAMTDVTKRKGREKKYTKLKTSITEMGDDLSSSHDSDDHDSYTYTEGQDSRLAKDKEHKVKKYSKKAGEMALGVIPIVSSVKKVFDVYSNVKETKNKKYYEAIDDLSGARKIRDDSVIEFLRTKIKKNNIIDKEQRQVLLSMVDNLNVKLSGVQLL